jgi:hypothetical protein
MLVRALIVLLSVLNLGAAAWWIAHDPPPPPAPAQVPAGVARLQLIDEGARSAPAPAPAPTTAVATTSPAAPAPPATDTITAPPAQQCFSFGPFASQGAASSAAAKLKPSVQHLTTREQAGAVATTRGWRVYLPPLPSLEQAQEVAQRIGAAGFDDYLVVREGAEANSIALGRYRNEEGAKKRADALIAAGFAAQVAALGEPGAASVWLDVVADEAFDPRRAQASIAAAQYRKADCPAR